MPRARLLRCAAAALVVSSNAAFVRFSWSSAADAALQPMLRGAATSLRVARPPRALLADGEDDEAVEREYQEGQRLRDSEALREEMEGAGSALVDDESMVTLREYMQVIEEKESNLEEMRSMLRAMEPMTGLSFIGDGGEFLPTAWVFVGLNVLVAAYLAKGLVVDPLLKTLATVDPGSAGAGLPPGF